MRKLILALVLLTGCPALEQSGLFARRCSVCRGAMRLDCDACERGRVECGNCTTVFGCKWCRFTTTRSCGKCNGKGDEECSSCAGSGNRRVQYDLNR